MMAMQDDQAMTYFIDLDRAPRMMQMPGLETTVLTGLRGEQMMMVLNATLPGHEVPTHSHRHEQVGMVYRGRARLTIGDEERLVGEGDFYCIPARVPHSDVCVGDEPFVMLDIFHPVREDFVARLAEASSGDERAS
jgi:quercetin dioxygenase-like cupin family protein